MFWHMLGAPEDIESGAMMSGVLEKCVELSSCSCATNLAKLPHEHNGAHAMFKLLMVHVVTTSHDTTTVYQMYITEFSLCDTDVQNVAVACQCLKAVLHALFPQNAVFSHAVFAVLKGKSEASNLSFQSLWTTQMALLAASPYVHPYDVSSASISAQLTCIFTALE